MGGSAVLLAISMGLAEPSGAVRGDELQVIGAASATFWLRTYSRWPVRVGGPKTETGRVLASGMASLKTCGEPENTSATFPSRSAAHKPEEGAIMFTGTAVDGRVDTNTFLACRVVVMGKLVSVPSLLMV